MAKLQDPVPLVSAIVEDQHGRLAYPIPELARKLGVNRRTIERRIDDGTFKTITCSGAAW